MLHREPEYRRRIRDKAAEDQKSAERERQEAAQDARIEKIIGTVEKLVEQVNRYTDEKAPENKRKGRWERAEVIGLWAAAFVGVAAIWYGTYDAHEQRDVMLKQIGEMQAEQRAWLSVSSDQHSGIAWDERGLRVNVLFNLKNAGRAPATDAFFEAKAVLPKIGEDATPLTAILAYVADIDRRRSQGRIAGQVYFPDQSKPFEIGLLVDRKEFSALLDASKLPDVMPRVIACVSYRSAGSGSFKHTCIGNYLGTTRDGNRAGVGLNEVVPSDRVMLSDGFYSYAD